MPLALALVGLIVGSFLATLALRWPAGRSLAGRSACDSCGLPLRAWELVPLLSYAVQAGRCRRCSSGIDIVHPGVELAATIIGAGAGLTFAGGHAVAMAGFGWTLLALAALDARAFWLPDALTLPLVAAGLADAWLGEPPLTDRVLGAAGGYLVLRLVAAVFKRLRGHDGLGGGDPKMLAAIGAWLGWQVLPHVLLGAALAGLLAVAAMRLAGRVVRGSDRLPFGTLLAAAALVVAVVG